MGLRALASAIQAGLQRQGITSNNIANLLTPGFRARRAEQQTVFGGGTRLGAASLDLSRGALQSTGDPLSVAVVGDAFLVVSDGNGGRAFTRAGNLGLNANGQLVTSNGQLVEPGIQVPAGTTGLRIGRDGRVAGVPPGATTEQVFGQIQVARFSNPGGLQEVGVNTFVATANSGAPQFGTVSGTGTDALIGGFVEGSNVELAREFTDQLLNLRAVQANVRAFRAQNDALGELLDLIQ